MADGHSGEHDRQVSFDRLPHVVIDRPGLQVVFGHAEALLDVPQLVVGICLALGASFNIPILAAVGSVVFDNLPILFAVGIAVGLTGEGTVAFSTMPDATWHPEARLSHIVTVDDTDLHPRARNVRWRIATDVDSPLCGPRGAAALFGPQKGATPTQVPALDHGLAHLAAVLQHASNGADVAGLAGAGAEEACPLCSTPSLHSRRLSRANWRRLSRSTNIAGQSHSWSCAPHSTTCPIVAIAGGATAQCNRVRAAGITAAFSIARGPAQLSELVKGSIGLIEDAASNVAGLFARLGGATRTAQVSRADHLK